MKKEVFLEQAVFDSDGRKMATLSTTLCGDGATPVIRTIGESASDIIGYNDDGTVIISNSVNEIINCERQSLWQRRLKSKKSYA